MRRLGLSTKLKWLFKSVGLMIGFVVFEASSIEFSIIVGVLLGFGYGKAFIYRLQRFVIDASHQQQTPTQRPWRFILSFLGTYGVLLVVYWLLYVYCAINLGMSLVGFALGFFPLVYMQARRLR